MARRRRRRTPGPETGVGGDRPVVAGRWPIPASAEPNRSGARAARPGRLRSRMTMSSSVPPAQTWPGSMPRSAAVSTPVPGDPMNTMSWRGGRSAARPPASAVPSKSEPYECPTSVRCRSETGRTSTNRASPSMPLVAANGRVASARSGASYTRAVTTARSPLRVEPQHPGGVGRRQVDVQLVGGHARDQHGDVVGVEWADPLGQVTVARPVEHQEVASEHPDQHLPLGGEVDRHARVGAGEPPVDLGDRQLDASPVGGEDHVEPHTGDVGDLGPAPGERRRHRGVEGCEEPGDDRSRLVGQQPVDGAGGGVHRPVEVLPGDGPRRGEGVVRSVGDQREVVGVDEAPADRCHRLEQVGAFRQGAAPGGAPTGDRVDGEHRADVAGEAGRRAGDGEGGVGGIAYGNGEAAQQVGLGGGDGHRGDRTGPRRRLPGVRSRRPGLSAPVRSSPTGPTRRRRRPPSPRTSTSRRRWSARGRAARERTATPRSPAAPS